MPTKKKEFFPTFLCLFFSVGTLTSVFKDNMSLRRHKTVENMVLNCFVCLDGRIRNRTHGSGSQRPKKYGSYGYGTPQHRSLKITHLCLFREGLAGFLISFSRPLYSYRSHETKWLGLLGGGGGLLN